jgi:hypothetical protein
MNGSLPGDLLRDVWVRVGRAAVAISAILWVATALVLLLADPPNQCPGWHLKNHHSSLWVTLLAFGLPWNLIGCLFAIRAEWALRKMIESEQLVVPATHTFVSLCLLNSATAQFPLGLLLLRCTPAAN